MSAARKQRGFLLIVAVVIILVAASMAAALVALNSGSAQSGGVHVLSTQALFASEAGLEIEQRRLAQDVDWYRSATDPVYVATGTVGQGTYSVYVNLPATALRTRMTTTTTTLNVFGGGTANRWPATGTLLIDDFTGDPEFVTYSSTTATTFTLTNTSNRNASVGSVQGSLTTHDRGDYVYPVAALGVALTASCTVVPNPFTIGNNSKFLDVGTLTVFHDTGGGVIDSEQITYSGYTVAGTTRTLLGVRRCQNGTSPIAAAVNDPVTTFVTDVGTNDLEAFVSSTGNVGTTQRREIKTVQR